jgi:YkoY family integral membrane protein
MFGQTFDWIDIPKVAILAFLEILLSADNAIVLALLTLKLPEQLRKKALFIGSASALFLRLLAILSIAYLLRYPVIQVFSGLYLLYIAARHLLKKGKQLAPTATASFWKSVLLIELFDLAFAVDSIVAALAFIGSSPSSKAPPAKLWIVFVGGMIGVFAIRFAAHLFTSLMQKFPRLEFSAYLMIGWIGLKLGASAFIPIYEPLFWTVLVLLFIAGLSYNKPHEPKIRP